jgi:hypothetical protein
LSNFLYYFILKRPLNKKLSIKKREKFEADDDQDESDEEMEEKIVETKQTDSSKTQYVRLYPI